jgi:hypothetical protein
VWPGLESDKPREDSNPEGLEQCAAEMVAVQRFNQKANRPQDEYQIAQADRILGDCCTAAA